MSPRFFGAGLLDDQSFIIHVKSSGPGVVHVGRDTSMREIVCRVPRPGRVCTGSARVTAWPADKSGGRSGRRDAELQST
jgi:hypothetical protein